MANDLAGLRLIYLNISAFSLATSHAATSVFNVAASFLTSLTSTANSVNSFIIFLNWYITLLTSVFCVFVF